MGSSETIRKLAFDGPFSIRQLILLAVLAIVVTGFFTIRECIVSNSWKRFFVLFPLRMGALVLVFWMLAGATMTTLLRETRPRSVLFLVDSSASMGLVDPVDGSGNAVTWSIAQKTSAGFHNLETLQHIVGKLRSAQAAVHSLGRQTQVSDTTPSDALWGQLTKSANSAATELGRLHVDAQNGSEIRSELEKVAQYLKLGIPSLSSHAETSTSQDRRSVGQLNEDRLEEAGAFLDLALRRLERILQILAVQAESSAASSDQAMLAAQSKVNRKDKVANWLSTGENSWLKDIETHSQLRRFTFASKVTSVSAGIWADALIASNNAFAETTDLAAALDRAAQESAQESVSAVVLVTDGGHNTSANPRDIATALRGVPLYIVPIGNQQMPRDVILHHAHCPRTVFKNDTLILDAMITAYDCEGERLQVELLNTNTVLETKTISVQSKFFDSRVEFHWKAAELGRQKLRLRVMPVPKEHSVENNEAQTEVEVMEDTIRVLIADARPRWEFRYLVNLFKRDKHIDFEQLLFEPKDETAAAPTLPRNLEAWRRYRVIILGDLSPEQLSPEQQDLLKKFVSEEAGNLIVIGGDTAMPSAFSAQTLATMLPTISNPSASGQEQRRALNVTPEGSLSVATQLDDDPLASEQIWREMSSKVPIYFSAECRPKATSHVLISASAESGGNEPEAFLSWQYVGLGRVVYIAAPVTYQLRYRNGDAHHHRFWGQLLRWAIAREMSNGSRTVRISADKSSYETGDAAQISVRVSHPDGRIISGGQVAIEARRGGQMLKLLDLHEDATSPGVYRAILDDLPAGPITLRASGSAVKSVLAEENHSEVVEHILTVDPKGSTELSNPLCNLPLLTQIADASGGAILQPASIPAALNDIPPVPDVHETVLRREPVWNRWIYLWLFLGCVTAEWTLRKYWRMG